MTDLRILHVLGQRPEMTGSGIYLEALIRESRKHGITCYRIAGIPAGSQPCPVDQPSVDGDFVFFDSEPLDFPVVGMSDVMPYRSSLFSELKGRRLTAYKAEFSSKLDAAVNRFRPDIVHANHLFLLSALVRKHFPQLPMVTTCHGTDLRQYEMCPHLRRFVRRYCRHIDQIIALSADQKMEIQKVYDIPADAIAVIGGGYDDTLFNRGPRRLAGTVQLLYAGKLNRSKGVPWLLRSLMKIADRDWHLHVAGGGNGPEFDMCIDLVRQLGDRVTLHGYVSHRRLAELMKQAHIQVLPSFFEGLPLVVLEALACGCRVVTTRLAGVVELLGTLRSAAVSLVDLPRLEALDRPHPEDSLPFEAALGSALAGQIEALHHALPVDAAAIVDRLSTFTWPLVFQRVEGLYRAAVGSGP
ncbi:MAG: glycosyltransferase family 4 protein [Desulfobacteraceae bacterium]|jgi:glycosyltransferase involved in cell wall biosynthesis